MFFHRQELQFKATPDQSDAVYARKLQEVLGGQYGEITVAMQDMFQVVVVPLLSGAVAPVASPGQGAGTPVFDSYGRLSWNPTSRVCGLDLRRRIRAPFDCLFFP
jgi:hypothetical protein